MQKLNLQAFDKGFEYGATLVEGGTDDRLVSSVEPR
jgi:hypothetical protein